MHRRSPQAPLNFAPARAVPGWTLCVEHTRHHNDIYWKIIPILGRTASCAALRPYGAAKSISEVHRHELTVSSRLDETYHVLITLAAIRLWQPI